MATIKRKHSVGYYLIRVFFGIIFGIVGIFFLWFVSWNCLKYWAHADYYAVKESLGTNPGLNDGYIPQGVSYLPEEDTYLTSGYMSDKSASRIYSLDSEEKVRYTELYVDGKPSTMHAGGMTVVGEKVLVASGDKIHLFSLSDVLNEEKSEQIAEYAVNNAASFCFAKGDYLFVGEFHDGGKYVTDHPYQTSDEETHYAIVSQYRLDEMGEDWRPVAMYSVTNRVQGFCVTDTGRIVMSTSYGIATSHYLVYDLSLNPIEDVDRMFLAADVLDQGIPVIYLDKDNLVEDLRGPAMAEDLDYHDGKVITVMESASNKYLFGKLFFYNDIVGLRIE